MDSATMKVMNLPRCGVPDVLSHNKTTNDKRVKRFSLQGSKWSTTGPVIRNVSSRIMAYTDISHDIKYPYCYRPQLPYRALHIWSPKRIYRHGNRTCFQSMEWIYPLNVQSQASWSSTYWVTVRNVRPRRWSAVWWTGKNAGPRIFPSVWRYRVLWSEVSVKRT